MSDDFDDRLTTIVLPNTKRIQFYSGLTAGQQSFLNDNGDASGLIYDYLNENNYSESSIKFIKQLINFSVTFGNNNTLKFLLYINSNDYSNESIGTINQLIDAITEYYSEFGSEPDQDLIDDLTEEILNPQNKIDEDITVTLPPSCESFNFTSTGSNWQEAAVVNIRFQIDVLSPPSQGGNYVNANIEYPQPILFGCPKILSIGNLIITPGIAATVSAETLRNAMMDTVHKYGNKPVSNMIIQIFFETRLKYLYPMHLPGGRININANTFSVVPTQYRTTASSGTGNCN